VNHELLYEGKELVVRAGELRRHEAVDLIRSAQLGMGLQKDDDVGMRKTPLLKLDGVKVASHVTEYAILDVTDKGTELRMEDTDDQVRAIRSRLSMEQVVYDFRPLGIGGHGDKEIATTKVPVDGQGILTMLLHVPGAPHKGRRKDDPLAQIMQATGVSIGSDRVHQALVKVRSEGILTGPELSKTLLLSDGPSFTDVLLKEIASKEEMDGFDVKRANVKAIAKELIQADVLPGFTLLFSLWVLFTLRLHRPHWRFIFQRAVRDPGVPTELARWEEKDVA
jgi:hypothetical protein